MSEELKPCPACGASRGLYVLYDEHDMEWFVFCDNCKTSICNERNDKREDAVRTWNRRAERACRNVSYCGNEFECSICGANLSGGDELGYVLTVGEWYAESSIRYCPNCGARVVEEEL